MEGSKLKPVQPRQEGVRDCFEKCPCILSLDFDGPMTV